MIAPPRLRPGRCGSRRIRHVGLPVAVAIILVIGLVIGATRVRAKRDRESPRSTAPGPSRQFWARFTGTPRSERIDADPSPHVPQRDDRHDEIVERADDRDELRDELT